MLSYTFVRPSNIRLALLEDIQLYSGDSKYLFPSTKSKSTPLSEWWSKYLDEVQNEWKWLNKI